MIFSINLKRCSLHPVPAHLGPINLRQILYVRIDHLSPSIEPITPFAQKLISITCNKGNFELIFKDYLKIYKSRFFLLTTLFFS